MATNLLNLAALYRAQGHYEEARPLFERALAFTEQALGSEHPHVATALENLAAVLQDEGRHAEAAPLMARCLAIDERNTRRLSAGQDASGRLAWVRSLRGHLDRWLDIAPHVGSTGYEEVLHFEGAIVRAGAAERRLMRAGGREAALRIEDLRAAERRLAKLAIGMPPVFQRKELAAWQEAYGAAGAERERLARDLARDFAPLREGLERLDLDLADVQAQLEPDEGRPTWA